jgi:hypothetical protein
MVRVVETVSSPEKGATRSTILCGDERAAPEWGMVRGSDVLTRGDVLRATYAWLTVRFGSDPGSHLRSLHDDQLEPATSECWAEANRLTLIHIVGAFAVGAHESAGQIFIPESTETNLYFGTG